MDQPQFLSLFIPWIGFKYLHNLTFASHQRAPADIWVRHRLPPSEPAVLWHSNNLLTFASSIALKTSVEHMVCDLSFSISL